MKLKVAAGISQWSRTSEGIERCTRARPDLMPEVKTTNQTKGVILSIHPSIYLSVLGAVGRRQPAQLHVPTDSRPAVQYATFLPRCPRSNRRAGRPLHFTFFVLRIVAQGLLIDSNPFYNSRPIAVYTPPFQQPFCFFFFSFTSLWSMVMRALSRYWVHRAKGFTWLAGCRVVHFSRAGHGSWKRQKSLGFLFCN